LKNRIIRSAALGILVLVVFVLILPLSAWLNEILRSAEYAEPANRVDLSVVASTDIITLDGRKWKVWYEISESTSYSQEIFSDGTVTEPVKFWQVEIHEASANPDRILTLWYEKSSGKEQGTAFGQYGMPYVEESTKNPLLLYLVNSKEVSESQNILDQILALQ